MAVGVPFVTLMTAQNQLKVFDYYLPGIIGLEVRLKDNRQYRMPIESFITDHVGHEFHDSVKKAIKTVSELFRSSKFHDY